VRLGAHKGADKYSVVAERIFELDSFDDERQVDLAPMLSPLPTWDRLKLIGRLTYKDQAQSLQTETFRTDMYYKPCCGAGAFGPSSLYNLMLPLDTREYPVYVPISNCVASKSADVFIIQVSAERSARFHVKFTLSASTSTPLEQVATVDVLVPRVIRPYSHFDRVKVERYLERKSGCT